jgi:hypothetical protein
MPARKRAKKATKKTAKQKEEAKAYDDVFEEPAKEPVPVAPEALPLTKVKAEPSWPGPLPEAPLIDLEDFDEHAPGQLAPSEDAESLSDAPKLIPPVVPTKEPEEPKTPSPEATEAPPAVKPEPPKKEGHSYDIPLKDDELVPPTGDKMIYIEKSKLIRIAQLIQGLTSDAKFLSGQLQLSPQNYKLMCVRREASEQVLTQITILLK